MSTLRALSKIISTGIDQIESACAVQGEAYPMLDDLYNAENDQIQNKYAAEAAPIIAAAFQLIATLTNPAPYIFTGTLASYFSASLAAAGQGCVADILREAGSGGMHVEEIAAKNNMDPDKLARVLRLLASRHVFAEESPDVFRNNRISASLCTGKSLPELQERPLEKWDGTNGGSAMAEFVGMDGVKAAGFLVENLTDPATSHSQEPSQAPFNRAFNTDLPFHMWLQEPTNVLHLKRVQIAMRSMTGYASGDLPAGGFDWSLVPEDNVVVDVGGGIGTVTMDIAAQHKHLRYVVQDLPGVVAQGKLYWKSTDPAMFNAGRIELQAHDFFKPQPVQDAAVYLVRYILHNWSDAYCLKMLERLRAAAGPNTKLVVMDQILEYLSRDSEPQDSDIPGTLRSTAPEPLLPYPDAVSGYIYFMDVLMMGLLNSQGRTLSHFRELLEKAGWKLDRVYRFSAPHPHQLVCSPI